MSAPLANESRTAWPGLSTSSRHALLAACRVATLGWLVFVGILLIVGTPAEFDQLGRVCSHCDEPHLTPLAVSQLHQLGLGPNAFAVYFTVIYGILSLICIALAGLVYRYRSRDLVGLLGAVFLATLIPISINGVAASLAHQQAFWRGPVDFAVAVGVLSCLYFFYLFPSGRFSPWMLWFIALLAVNGLGVRLFSWFPDLSSSGITFGLAVVSFAALQIYRYRKVLTPLERQQAKWVVFGTVGAFTAWIVTLAGAQLIHPLHGLRTLQEILLGSTILYVYTMAIPVSIAVAMLRYRLWDVDVLINRTLVYGSLTVSLAAVYLGGVLGLQAIFRGLTGQGSNLAIALSTLAIAALFQPLRRRIQGLIDQRFYRRKYDSARTMARLSTRLRDEIDLEDLSREVVRAVEETVQPVHVSLWLLLKSHHGSR